MFVADVKKAANEDNHLSGSTATMVLLHGHKLFASWVWRLPYYWSVKSGSPGDVVAISKDHKASREDEENT